ncbi:uncharacterized protein LOC144622553 isoform X1 [Crassostrea virginica]
MREFLTYYFVVLTIIKVESCAADGNCSNKKQVHCCNNYFLDNGICKVCLPGYFGMNCSSQCPFPSFGVLCSDTCQCNATECNHVNGCQSNINTEKRTTIASSLSNTAVSSNLKKNVCTLNLNRKMITSFQISNRVLTTPLVVTSAARIPEEKEMHDSAR